MCFVVYNLRFLNDGKRGSRIRKSCVNFFRINKRGREKFIPDSRVTVFSNHLFLLYLRHGIQPAVMTRILRVSNATAKENFISYKETREVAGLLI